MYKNKTEIFLILGLLHFSSKATTIAYSNPFLIIFFIITAYVFYRRELIIERKIILLIVCFFAISFIHLVSFEVYNAIGYSKFIFRLLLAYFVIRICGMSYLEKLIHVSYIMAIICLILYLFQVFWTSGLFKLYTAFNSLLPIQRYDSVPSIIIHSFSIDWPIRNYGFMHEPSHFGIYLNILLFLSLTLNGLRFTKREVILILAVITSFSTAAYLGLFLVLIYYFANLRKKYWLLLILPIMSFVGYNVWQLDFMADKIEESMYYESNIDDRLAYDGSRTGISVGKYGSFLLDMRDLKRHPLLGYGENLKLRTQGLYVAVERTNGLSDFAARYGIVGLLFVTIGLYKTIRAVNYNNVAYLFLFPLLVYEGLWGDVVLIFPLFMSFALYGFVFEKWNEYYKNEQYKSYINGFNNENKVLIKN